MKHLSDILNMNVQDRLLMMQKIWESLDKEQIELSSEQKAELDSRLKAHESGTMPYSTWESVEQRLKNR